MENFGILLENDGLAGSDIYDWIHKHIHNWVEVNPSMNQYMREDDFHWFAKLIDPSLTDLFVSSAFERRAPFACQKSFRGMKNIDTPMKQVEYFSYIIRQAVMWRRNSDLPKLTLHVNYLYDNLLEDLEKGELGDDTRWNILGTIRQAQGWLTVKVYRNYEHIASIIENDQNYALVTVADR